MVPDDNTAPQQGQTLASTIPHTATVSAVLNPPPEPVTLYHPDGRQITASTADVATFLTEGWSLAKYDLDDVARGLALLFDSAKAAAATYAANVKARGLIAKGETSDALVLTTALNAVLEQIHRLVHTAHALYPHQEDSGVTVQHTTNQASVTVDPSQVDTYTAQGYAPVAAPEVTA